jgi:hypothetical protein
MIGSSRNAVYLFSLLDILALFFRRKVPKRIAPFRITFRVVESSILSQPSSPLHPFANSPPFPHHRPGGSILPTNGELNAYPMVYITGACTKHPTERRIKKTTQLHN